MGRAATVGHPQRAADDVRAGEYAVHGVQVGRFGATNREVHVIQTRADGGCVE
jgi:hypothetical protein